MIVIIYKICTIIQAKHTSHCKKKTYQANIQLIKTFGLEIQCKNNMRCLTIEQSASFYQQGRQCSWYHFKANYKALALELGVKKFQKHRMSASRWHMFDKESVSRRKKMKKRIEKFILVVKRRRTTDFGPTEGQDSGSVCMSWIVIWWSLTNSTNVWNKMWKIKWYGSQMNVLCSGRSSLRDN